MKVFRYFTSPIWVLMLFLLITIMSCRGKPRGLDDTLTPLFELKVSLQTQELNILPDEVRRRLHVGILWAGIQIPSEWCAEQISAILLAEEGEEGHQEVDDKSKEEETDQENDEAMIDFARLAQVVELCPDPFGVHAALSGPVSPWQEDEGDEQQQVTTLTFTALPSAEVLIGTPDARVGYGVLVIFDDVNENGVLDIGFQPPPFMPSDDDFDKDDDPDEGGQGWWKDEQAPDIIYASSFNTLLSSHTRVVFREGSFVESFYYPLGGCVPPKGLSVLKVEGGFEEAMCESLPLDTPIPLSIVKPTKRTQELICDTQGSIWVSPPDESTPPDDLEAQCLSTTELALTDPEADCPNLTVLSLLDCSPFETACVDPEWNLQTEPPDWWPCGDSL